MKDLIKSLKKLTKSKNPYSFYHLDNMNGNGFTVYAHHDTHGDVGHASFTHKKGKLIPDDLGGTNTPLFIDPEHRRKGLTDRMYAYAEKTSGKKIEHSQTLSAAGEKFAEYRVNNAKKMMKSDDEESEGVKALRAQMKKKPVLNSRPPREPGNDYGSYRGSGGANNSAINRALRTHGSSKGKGEIAGGIKPKAPTSSRSSSSHGGSSSTREMKVERTIDDIISRQQSIKLPSEISNEPKQAGHLSEITSIPGRAGYAEKYGEEIHNHAKNVDHYLNQGSKNHDDWKQSPGSNNHSFKYLGRGEEDGSHYFQHTSGHSFYVKNDGKKKSITHIPNDDTYYQLPKVAFNALKKNPYFEKVMDNKEVHESPLHDPRSWKHERSYQDYDTHRHKFSTRSGKRARIQIDSLTSDISNMHPDKPKYSISGSNKLSHADQKRVAKTFAAKLGIDPADIDSAITYDDHMGLIDKRKAKEKLANKIKTQADTHRINSSPEIQNMLADHAYHEESASPYGFGPTWRADKLSNEMFGTDVENLNDDQKDKISKHISDFHTSKMNEIEQSLGDLINSDAHHNWKIKNNHVLYDHEYKNERHYGHGYEPALKFTDLKAARDKDENEPAEHDVNIIRPKFGKSLLMLLKKSENKTINLEHYSNAPDLHETGIDPKFHGTGVAGNESKRKKHQGWVDRSYHYIQGTEPERQLKNKPHKYTSSVDSSKIYDMANDHQNIKEQSKWGDRVDPTLYESNIKKAGYSGYMNSSHPTMSNVVAMFDTVYPNKNLEKSQIDDSGDFEQIDDADHFVNSKNLASPQNSRIKENTTEIQSEDALGHKMFLTKDKKSGYMISPDGELKNIFSAVKGRGDSIINHAKQQGALHGNAFEGYLTKLYAKHGAKEYKREKNYDPNGPDVVYMSLKKSNDNIPDTCTSCNEGKPTFKAKNSMGSWWDCPSCKTTGLVADKSGIEDSLKKLKSMAEKRKK